MSNSPLISVIVPVYNVEKYLRQCLNSIINQTLKDIEIICVDDGSTDGSPAILEEYAKTDDRIKVITKPNAGYGHTMNVGIDAATGEYIGIIESDDWIVADMYEELYGYATKYDVDYAKGDYYYCWTSKKKKKYYNCIMDSSLYNKVITDLYNPALSPPTVANWAAIYKRKFLVNNNIKHLETPGASYQDQVFYYKIIFYAKNAYFINKPVYYYRQDNMNSSINNKDKIYCIFDEYEEIQNILSTLENKERFYPVLARKKFNSCMWNYNRIDKRYKKDFLIKLSENFIADYKSGVFKKAFFNSGEWSIIARIITDYNSFLQFNVNYSTIRKIYIGNMPGNAEGHEIPIILASDEKYARYMYVTIISVIANRDYDTKYDFYLLVPNKFSEKWKTIFYNLKDLYNNVNVNIIDMGKDYADCKQMIAHITYPAYYRLSAANILTERYKQCVYIDTDVIVLKDFTEYYNIKLADNYVGGVQAFGYFDDMGNREYYNKHGLHDLSKYINVGVILLNLSEIRKNNMVPKMIEYSKRNFLSQDQDVINILFSGRIKILPLKYNLMTKYHEFFNKKSNKWVKISNFYSVENVEEALADPVIIHYADRLKPWHSKHIWLANIWWEYALVTPFYKKFVYKKQIIDIIKAIFSVSNEGNYKVIRLFGIKIKCSKRKK